VREICLRWPAERRLLPAAELSRLYVISRATAGRVPSSRNKGAAADLIVLPSPQVLGWACLLRRRQQLNIEVTPSRGFAGLDRPDGGVTAALVMGSRVPVPQAVAAADVPEVMHIQRWTHTCSALSAGVSSSASRAAPGLMRPSRCRR
jgi:hypothetical protein